MSALISFGVGFTADSAAATTVVIQPPPVYAAGNLLIMGVIASNSSGGVAPELPSGWTQLSGGGATLALFWKTATASESAYTVTLTSSAIASGFVAAYPASTLGSFTSGNSGSGVVTWAATFPGGVTAGQTVLMVAGSVAASYQAGDPFGTYYNTAQNLNFPSSGWSTDVPVFGPVNSLDVPADDSDALPCCLGLAEVAGSTGNPTLTTPIGGEMYAGFLILTVTGDTPNPYQVTATSSGASTAAGMALAVKALTGAQPAAQQITGSGVWSNYYANGTLADPAIVFTPYASGSMVYGAVTENQGVTSGSTYTPYSASTTFLQNIADTNSLAIYGTFKYGPTTSGSITTGGSAPQNAQFVCAAVEVLAASGKTIAEVATALVSATSASQYTTATAEQTAVFTTPPPGGSLLIAMVSANEYIPGGGADITITDNLGLTWYPAAYVVTPAYAGVWIAQMPLDLKPVSLQQAVMRAAVW